MAAEIIGRNEHEVILQVTIDVSGTMLEAEGRIQEGCHAVGRLASAEALKRFDTDGSAITMGAIKWTKRCASPQTYHTPYGTVALERNVYQTSKGGRIYCPLDVGARIIRHATPLFAKQLSHKYAQMNVNAVCADLGENHGRPVTASYVQNVTDWVGGIACAKEETWEYALPPLEGAVATVAVSLDGAMLAMKEDGWREAMAGSVSLYDPEGERRHTLYVAAAPESGKQTFLERMTREIERLKATYPEALYLGLADGAASNWSFLEQHTERQLIDYCHAAEYLPAIAMAAYPGKTDQPKRAQWLHAQRHHLKHTPGAVDALIEEAERLTAKRSLTRTVKDDLQAACKTLVKQRLCGAGMRWKHQGAKIILSLRALVQSTGRWAQFWDKIDQFGAQPC